MPTTELYAVDLTADQGVKPATEACTPVITSQGYVQWLLWFRRLLPATQLVLFRVRSNGQQAVLERLGCYPESQMPGEALVGLAERCLHSGSVVYVNDKTDQARSAVCFPDCTATAGKPPRYILLLKRPSAANRNLSSDARLASWALRALELIEPRHAPRTSYPTLMQWILDSQSSVGETSVRQCGLMDQIAESCSASCCQLVRLKTRRGKVVAVQLLALSGQVKVNRRLAASRARVSCIEQRYLGLSQPLPVHHASGSASDNTLDRLIIPVACEKSVYAVSIERDSNLPFSESDQSSLTQAIHLSVSMLHFTDGQVLGVTAACQRTLRKAAAWIKICVPRAALVAIAVLIALLYLLYPVEQRVTAPLSVEAAQRHVLIAPADGFVESVTARAGDTVSKGEVLATLEDLDLQLQRQKLQSEQLHNQQAFAEALAVHDRINVTRLKEAGALIEKELTQLDVRAQRMVLTSPADAVVLSGSWDDFLGAAVKAGETLYSLGSTDAHKLVMDVSEYDIQSVHPGQAVGIRLSANPSQVLQGVVTAIMPLAVTTPSGNSVQVHATLTESIELLPGMQGLGKIQIAQTPRLVQWSQRVGSRVLWLGWKSGLIR